MIFETHQWIRMGRREVVFPARLTQSYWAGGNYAQTSGQSSKADGHRRRPSAFDTFGIPSGVEGCTEEGRTCLRNGRVRVKLRVGMALCLLLTPFSLYSQQRPDSVTISGSPEIGNPRNQLIERIQYRDGSLFRNDFVRDYSPFEEKTLRLDSVPSFSDELLYRDAGRKSEITLTEKENSVSATLIPLLGGTVYASRGGHAYVKRSNGLAVSGSVGPNIVFYAKAIDNLVRGSNPDMKGSLSSQPGYVNSTLVTSNGYDYDDTEMQLGFRFGIVNLFFEKIRNTWGYGRGGQLVLSQRAPSYPQIRASVQLFHNVKFTVLAAFLNSGVIDSIGSYINYSDGTYQNLRVVYRSKYLFGHVLEYSPTEQMNLAIGEEVVVSDRFTPEFLILPFSFYHNLSIQAGGVDNMNIWGGGRYTFPALGSVYSTVYVDDFDASRKFYIVAGTVGGTLVDIDHRKLDLTLEYTALRPFVYANDITALYRTSNDYPLGDWLGQNAERIQAWVDYRPIPQLWFTASFMKILKGVDGQTAQEYGTAPINAVGFLSGPLFRRSEFAVRGRWEMHPGFFADVSYRLMTQSDAVAGRYPGFSNRSFVSLALKLNIFDQNDEW
jgi:hypothetical protein